MHESDADIICLQEYIVNGKLKKKDVDYALRKYPYRHYHSLAKGRNGLGCYSKYPILSATPVKYQSKVNGSIAYQFKIGNDTLLVVNNHLESNRIGDSEVDAYQEVIESRDGKKVSSGIWKLMKKMAEAIKIRAKQAETVREETEKFHGKRRKRFGNARIPGKVSEKCVKITKPDGKLLSGFVRNDGVAVFGEKIAKCY
mgnify:CR=1 FL=1